MGVEFKRTDKPVCYGLTHHGQRVHATVDYEWKATPLCNQGWGLHTVKAEFADVPTPLRCEACDRIYQREYAD